MKIEHIALYVKNLETTKHFYMKYFNAKCNHLYHNQKTGFRSYFLSFSDGARIEIMNRPDIAESSEKEYRTGYAHIAFSVGSADEVNRLTELLRNDGYLIASEPRTTGDGYYESCVLDTEGNSVEITV